MVSKYYKKKFILNSVLFTLVISEEKCKAMEEEEGRSNVSSRQITERDSEQDSRTSCLSGCLSCLKSCLAWYCNSVSNNWGEIQPMIPNSYPQATPTQPTYDPGAQFRENRKKEERQWNDYKRTGTWS